MKIITISGIDGSGKTTQINLLKNYLEAQGRRVFYFHAVNFSIANKIIQALKKIFYSILRSEYTVKDKNSNKSVTRANWFQILLRKYALIVDLMRFKKLISALDDEGYNYLVSDRYFYDSVVNIEYLSGGSTSNWRLNLKIPKPDLAVYLEVDPDEVMKRGRVPDQGLEYLRKKKGLYDKRTGDWGITPVDGSRPEENISEDIINLCQNNI